MQNPAPVHARHSSLARPVIGLYLAFSHILRQTINHPDLLCLAPMHAGLRSRPPIPWERPPSGLWGTQREHRQSLPINALMQYPALRNNMSWLGGPLPTVALARLLSAIVRGASNQSIRRLWSPMGANALFRV